MLTTILRLLLLLFVFRLFFRFVAGLLRGYRGAAQERSAPAAGTALVRDRVCNTFVPRDGAVKALVDGHTEYFCSEKCLASAVAAEPQERVSGARPSEASSVTQPHESQDESRPPG
jgi:YHS domain-containing protein